MTVHETRLVKALQPLLSVAEFIELTVSMPPARQAAFRTAIADAKSAIAAAEAQATQNPDEIRKTLEPKLADDLAELL